MSRHNISTMLFQKSSYLDLPDIFYSRESAATVKNPSLIKVNESLLADFNVKLTDKDYVDFFSGNKIPKELTPISIAYAGHQFGHFNPNLGDGRALLLAEIVDKDGQKFDVQLKGSGRTAYSRRGDGKSALGPVIREYVMSEAMYYLGIETTRSLAIINTGEYVERQEIEPGGILTRVAASHIRVGTFEYFAAQGDKDSLKKLADYAIDRHYISCLKSENPYLDFLKKVIDAQARLMCEWMRVGFIHGVMNTDNMTISGETIDYGPCAFLDEYDANKVFSSIDVNKRYAFGNQAAIASWNLTRLAESLLPLLDVDIEKAVQLAEKELLIFGENYRQYWLEMMRQKFGLFEKEKEDVDLIQEFLGIIQDRASDYTLSFRHLSGDLAAPVNFLEDADYLLFSQKLDNRLKRESRNRADRVHLMNSVNPIYIPRNHLVEDVIKDVVENDDLTKMNRLLEILKNPSQSQDGCDYYALPPENIDHAYRTFCGT